MYNYDGMSTKSAQVPWTYYKVGILCVFKIVSGFSTMSSKITDAS